MTDSLLESMKQRVERTTNFQFAQNKRTRRALQFADVSKANIEAVTELINLAQKLVKEERLDEAKPIMGIISDLLKNNEKLQQVVGEALLDIQD